MERPSTATVSSGSRMAGTSLDELLDDDDGLRAPSPSAGEAETLPAGLLGSTRAGYVGCSGEVGGPGGGGGAAWKVGKKGGAGAGGVWDGGAVDWSGTKGWCSCRLAAAGAASTAAQEEASRSRSRIGRSTISGRGKRRKDGIFTGDAS